MTSPSSSDDLPRFDEGRVGPLVVFLGHATDRTGPPIVLLHLLRWLHQNTDWRLATVALSGGALLDDFEEVGPVFVLEELTFGPWPQEAAADERRREALAPIAHPDLVFVNTAWSIHALRFLEIGDHTPILASIHELDTDLRDGMPPSSLADLIGRPDHFLAGATVMADNLVAGYGVPRDRITVVPESISLPDLDRPPVVTPADLAIEPGDIVVMAAGTPVWRKGPDLFVQLAWLVRRARPDLRFRFIWLGADPDAGDPDLQGPLVDRSRLGLEGMVTFLPPTTRVFDHLRLADIFLLTSREDASPLVCLEAAAVARAVVCFDNGGIPDVLGDDGGVTISYPDLEAMAQALVDLATDPERRRRLGEQAQARIREGHDIEQAGPRIHSVIAACLR